MQDCQVCGRRFDPLRFQVVVPELARGFDRLECARSARSAAGPGAKIAAAPLVTVVEPFAALAAPSTSRVALRPLGAPAATLGLLAAGTAAAVLLWLRVLGTDPARFPFDRSAAPPAVAGETMAAQDGRAPTETGPQPAGPPAEQPVPDASATVLAAAPVPDAGGPRAGGTRARPVSSRPLVTRTATRSPARSAPADSTRPGKGHGKGGLGLGLGHQKHGDSAASHRPGHGHAHGHGHGKGH